MRLSAVITGDIVHSTSLKGDYKKVLHHISDDIRTYFDNRFVLDIYRGDSFQAITNTPEYGLLFLLLLRAGLRRHSDEAEESWDARVALGVGALEEYPTGGSLGELSGTPFVHSGRALDSLKDGRITIVTGVEAIDAEFKAVSPLLDVIITGWISTQAEAIYYYLLQNLTQKDLGEKLGISQRAAGKRLESGNIYQVQQYEDRYKNLIEWNFNK